MQKDLLLLRRWWLGFAVLIAAGLLSHLFFSPYGSAWQLYQGHPKYYWFRGLHAAFFGLMAAATYRRWLPLWWFAFAFISLKRYRLLKYYVLVDYGIMSVEFNEDYLLLSYRLARFSRWLGVPGKLSFSNKAFSVAFLTTLYSYWLTTCWRLVPAGGAAGARAGKPPTAA